MNFLFKTFTHRTSSLILGVLFIGFFTIFSCSEENDIVEISSGEVIDQRSVEDETQFRLYLNDLVNLFEQSNSDSNGDLALLISDITDLSYEEAVSQLSNSGLIDMEQLTNLIYNAEALEEALVNKIGEENVQLIVEDETGGIDPPQKKCFWCKTCTPWAGGSMDGSCGSIRECLKTRFWISGNWNQEQGEC